MGVAADLYVRTIAVERLDPVGHAWAIVVRAVSVASIARALAWSWSHDTCLTASAMSNGTGWAASACRLSGGSQRGVSCGFIVCDRSLGGSCFCNARRLQSINSKSIMAGRRSFISRSTCHVSAGISHWARMEGLTVFYL